MRPGMLAVVLSQPGYLERASRSRVAAPVRTFSSTVMPILRHMSDMIAISFPLVVHWDVVNLRLSALKWSAPSGPLLQPTSARRAFALLGSYLYPRRLSFAIGA